MADSRDLLFSRRRIRCGQTGRHLFPQSSQSLSHVLTGLGIGQGLSPHGQGLGLSPLPAQHQAQVVPGRFVVRLPGQDLPETDLGLIQPTLEV